MINISEVTKLLSDKLCIHLIELLSNVNNFKAVDVVLYLVHVHCHSFNLYTYMKRARMAEWKHNSFV